MWRRYILKVAPSRKAVARTFVEESENKQKTSQTEMTESELKDSEKKHKSDDTIKASEESEKKIYTSIMMGVAEFLKLSCAGINMKKATDKELDRLMREEHIILFGKPGYGKNLMHNVLLGPDNFETGKQTSKPKSIGSSFKFGEVESFHKKHRRHIKITSVNVEEKSSLSSLAISEEYTAVFCFPVSFRFTSEDLDVLDKYLQYRQREDFKRVTVAFTFSDRKEVSDKDYIDNLPKEMKDFLKKYGENYVFISSGKNSFFENEQSVKRLLKPLPSDEYLESIKDNFVLFAGLLIFRMLGIPYF